MAHPQVYKLAKVTFKKIIIITISTNFRNFILIKAIYKYQTTQNFFLDLILLIFKNHHRHFLILLHHLHFYLNYLNLLNPDFIPQNYLILLLNYNHF
jgi:hypothetical protein